MKIITLILSILIISSCSSRKKLNIEDTKVSQDGVVGIWANWVKDKGKKYDVQFAIENLSKKGIIINLRDIRCFKGKVSGRLKHTFFNTGERTMDFGEGEVKQFNLVCRLMGKAEGPYKIVINKVYSNPNGDGSTRGKVIGKKIEWKLDQI